MVKMKYKISFLVLLSLSVLGIVMGGLSVLIIEESGKGSIETLDSKLRQDFDTMSQYQIELAISVVESFYNQRDELGEDRAMYLARKAVDEMRYGDNNYFYIYDSKGNTVSLPDDSLEGTNRWTLQDKRGNYIVQDLIKFAKDGTHYMTYYYTRAGGTELFPKRSYNDYFEPWDWSLGTGNYVDDIDLIVKAEEDSVDDSIRKIIFLIILTDLVVILISFLFSWILGGRFARPVEQLVIDVKAIAEGDLTTDIKVKSNDETGLLANALIQMSTQLREIVSGIMESASMINRYAREVSEVSQRVASGANEQAASAEEISSSMEELSSNIQQNTNNARESNNIVAQVAKDADVSGQSVEDSVNSMKFISEKISIIEEIARSTNLLALNAAIEAARAGEFGKGFAVVAAEIRKLAENSQTAANDITQVSKESVVKADITLEQIRAIVPVIKKSADISEEIFEGSNEQAKGAEQINTALLQMDQVIQVNAASSEEIASMSEQLSHKSEDLTEMISYFTIGESEKNLRQRKAIEPAKSISVNPTVSQDDKGDFEEF